MSSERFLSLSLSLSDRRAAESCGFVVTLCLKSCIEANWMVPKHCHFPRRAWKIQKMSKEVVQSGAAKVGMDD